MVTSHIMYRIYSDYIDSYRSGGQKRSAECRLGGQGVPTNGQGAAKNPIDLNSKSY